MPGEFSRLQSGSITVMLKEITSAPEVTRAMWCTPHLILSLFCLLFFQPSTATVIYVTPTPPTTCPGQPCHNLSYYANHSAEFLKSNTTMIFLPGEHMYKVQISVNGAKNFSMFGDPEYMTTTVVCKGSDCGGFLFVNVSLVLIQNLKFISDSHSVVASLIQEMHVKNCTFAENNDTAFHALNCSLAFDECKFISNSDQGLAGKSLSEGAGIVIVNSTMTLTGQNYFFNNTCLSDHCGGSAVYAQYSRVTVKGNATLVKNTVNITLDSGKYVPKGGGGALFLSSDVEIVGQMILIDNLVSNTFLKKDNCEIYGGAASFVKGNVSVSGQVLLLNNVAKGISGCGGGLYLHQVGVSISGHLELVNNSAGYFSGGILIDSCSIVVAGNLSLTNNSGKYSGGLAIHGSTMDVQKGGNVEFYDNTASFDGGGIESEDSKINVNGTLIFSGNSALYGGGIISLRSSFDIAGLMSLTDNHAVYEICENGGHGQGGGVNIQQKSSLSISGEAVFLSNTACVSGALYVDSSSVTVDGNITISNNVAAFTVGGMLIGGSNATIGNGLISNNSALAMGGMLVQGGGSVIVTERLVVKNNIASGYTIGGFGGGIVVVENSKYNVSGTLEVLNNSAVIFGGGVVAQQSEFTVSGHAVIANNVATLTDQSNGGGMVLRLYTTLTVFGTMSVINNRANHSGGGMLINDTSKLVIQGRVNFTANHAGLIGGALFVQDTTKLVYCAAKIEGAECVIEDCFFKNISSTDNDPLMVFERNEARSGTVLHGGSVDRCVIDGQPDANSGEVFNAITDYSKQPDTHSLISSYPYHVCLCENHEPRCGKQINITTAYPGETFSFQAVAVGQRNGTIFEIVINAVPHFLPRSATRLGVFEDRQIAYSTCTQLNYTLFSKVQVNGLQLYVYGSCSSLDGSENRLVVPVHLTLPCPPAFTLSNEPHHCICEERLQKYTNSCDINGKTILRDGDFWVGYDNESNATGLILHPHCPFDYCKSKPINFTLNEIDLQCKNNRTGLLCGSCGPELSLAIGTTNCLPCSNAHLSLIILFAVMGIVLMLLFFVFNKVLTVKAGMISGLIFYASIVGTNKKIFFPPGKENVVGYLVTWFNLDFGFHTCFYDGMDMYAKTWLQLVFPFYLFAIISLVLLFRKCRRNLADRIFFLKDDCPQSVLATFFILSFGKIVHTIIVAFSYTTLQYPDRQELVWLYDANVKYLHGKHVPLFIVSLILSVVVVLPFTIILFFGQWIENLTDRWPCSWIKKILVVYHKPYDENYRYWPGLLLLVRLALFIAFGVNALTDYGENLLAISAAAFGLLAWPWISGGQVYKYIIEGSEKADNRFFGVLEASYLLNLGVFAVATFYVQQSGGNQEVVAYVSTGVALASFLVTIVYSFVNDRKDIKANILSICIYFRSHCKCRRTVEMESQSLNASDSKHQQSYNGTDN